MRRPPSLTRNVLWRTGIALGLGMAIIALVAALATGKFKAGIGGGKTEVTSVKTTVGAVETTITTTPQDAKTLWDWLSLLVVPASLAGLGALLQLKEQRRAEQQADLEREIADKNRQQDLKIAQGTREEEALQHYLDRVSNLVIEKNLLAIAAKVAKEKNTPEEKELLNVSLDVIRTMTLTVLRRLDGGRKRIVVQFLFESNLISSHFYEEDPAKANRLTVGLKGADLSSANLSHAHLNGAKFRLSILSSANLSHAHLLCADFRQTNLNGAKLYGAWLQGANLSGADLRCAEGLTKEQLENAFLCFGCIPVMQ
jgi:uncharacterized protein YjbI with pentapeptide repeats